MVVNYIFRTIKTTKLLIVRPTYGDICNALPIRTRVGKALNFRYYYYYYYYYYY